MRNGTLRGSEAARKNYRREKQHRRRRTAANDLRLATARLPELLRALRTLYERAPNHPLAMPRELTRTIDHYVQRRHVKSQVGGDPNIVKGETLTRTVFDEVEHLGIRPGDDLTKAERDALGVEKVNVTFSIESERSKDRHLYQWRRDVLRLWRDCGENASAFLDACHAIAPFSKRRNKRT